MYLTYEKYAQLGGQLSDADFKRFSFMAENAVNRHTHRRVAKDWPNIDYAERLEMLMFELVQIVPVGITVNAVTQESNDGLSRTIAATSRQEIDSRIYDLCNAYLSDITDSTGVPLMYLGLGVGR